MQEAKDNRGHGARAWSRIAVHIFFRDFFYIKRRKGGSIHLDGLGPSYILFSWVSSSLAATQTARGFARLFTTIMLPIFFVRVDAINSSVLTRQSVPWWCYYLLKVLGQYLGDVVIQTKPSMCIYTSPALQLFACWYPLRYVRTGYNIKFAFKFWQSPCIWGSVLFPFDNT